MIESESANVTNITSRHADQGLQNVRPIFYYSNMNRIDKENDEALAEYYASLVDDRDEDE